MDLGRRPIRGSTSHELGELKLAAEWFEQAYRYKLGDIDAMFNHAQISFQLGEYPQASVLCRRILELHPNDQSTINLLSSLPK